MATHFEADRHNFGRAVEMKERASGTWFQKPRSVFWEHLFFGKDSPLLPIFQVIGPNGSEPVSKYLFNLEVEVIDAWGGVSKEVLGEEILPTPEHFYGFGVLLGYSYLFGIRDLHCQNVVMTRTHLQAIDAEVVLTNLLLPHESVLLPFKDVTQSFAGIGKFGRSVASFSAEEINALFSGYVDLMSVAFSQVEPLLKSMAALDLKSHPVRVIIRNTGIYRAHISGAAPLGDLLPEEARQLERGDIPYFFRQIGRPDLLWVSSSNLDTAAVQALGPFQKDVQRHANDPIDLIPSSAKVFERLIHGLLFLQRKFPALPSILKFDNRTIALNAPQLTFSNPSQIFSS